jgi:hypothetical protein
MVEGSGGACCLTGCHEQRTGGTKAVPGALLDRCREAYRRDYPEPYLVRVGGENRDRFAPNPQSHH